MWGMVLGGAILAVLAIVAAIRPLKFRVAMGYAWAARKAMIPVILGLSTITAVLGAAAIIEDSAVQGVRDSFVSPFHAVDGVISSWTNEGIAQSELDEFLAHPLMAPILDATSVRSARIAAEGPTGLGDIYGSFWVVEPADYDAFVDFQVLDGAIPSSWGPRDAVLDERAAIMYGVTAGDELTTFIGATPVPFLDETAVDGRYNFTTGLSGVYGAAAEDTGRRNLATLETQSYDWVRISVLVVDSTQPLDEDDVLYLVLVINGVEYTYLLPNEDNSQYDFFVYGEEEVGTWEIYVEPANVIDNAATDVHYNGTIQHEGHRIPEARLETMNVRAIIDNSGTPLRNGPTVIVGPSALPVLFDHPPAVDAVFLDIADDVDHSKFQADMAQVSDEVFSGYARAEDIQYEVEQLTREIELAVGPTFIAFGSLSIGAGLVLVVVLVNLIVEERRRVLGTLRAVGATRGQVQTMVLHELAAVALVSIVAGTAFAALLAAGVHGLIQALLDGEAEALTYVVRPSAIFDAAGWAFSLILAAAWFGARRALRASPNELLRDHPDPPTKRAWIGQIVAVVLSAAAAIPLLIWAPPAYAWLLAGTAVALTFTALIAKLIRLPVLLDAAMAILFAVILGAMLGNTVTSENEILLYPLQGLFLVALGSALLVRRIAGIFRNTGFWRVVNIVIIVIVLNVFSLLFLPLLIGKYRSMGEMAAGNLRDRPGRQTAILAVLATSILMITAMSLMFQTLGPGTPDEDGGFPVIGSTQLDIGDAATYYADNPPKSGADPFELSEIVLTVPTARQWDSFGIPYQRDDTTYVSSGNSWGRFDVGLELTDQLASGLQFDEIQYAPGVTGWDDAVSRVQRDDHAVILSGQVQFYDRSLEDSEWVPPSFNMNLVDQEDKRPMKVVAIVPGAGNFAALLNGDRFDEAHNDRDSTYVMFRPKDGVDITDLAESAASAFRSAGMEITDMEEEFKEERRVEITIQTILGLFLGLGILVGMLSLALIAQRTYRQRQGSLAILRAVGATQGRVIAGFVAEQVLVVVLAVALGLVIGLLMAGSMLLAVEDGITLRVNGAFITGILGATLVGGALVGLLPALKIRRMKLAEALRYE